MEHLAFDRRAFEQAALLVLELLEPSSQQAVDCRRHGHLAATVVLGEHREHLLEKERVALRGNGDAFPRLRRDIDGGRQGSDQQRGLLGRERVEQDRGSVELAAGPAGPPVEQLRPGEAEDEHGHVPHPISQVLDQIQQRRLCPVDVLEHEQHGPLAREHLDQPAHGPENLFLDGPARAGTDRALDPLGDGVRVRVEQLANAAIACHLRHDLPHRPVGDALAVGQTAAREHARLTLEQACELLRQPALADARRAEHRHQMTAPLSPGALERLAELGELELPANEWHLEVARQRLATRQNFQQAERRHRLRLALQRQWRDRLCPDDVLDEPVGGLADEHVAGRRCLLQPGSNVDRVPEGQRPARIRISHDDLARVDPRARAQPETELPLQLVVERLEPCAHLRRRTNSTQRVILMHRRDAKRSHHGVANQPPHPAAVRLAHRPHLLVPTQHQPAQRLCVEALADRGRPCHIGEQDRDHLAKLARGGIVFESDAAGEAEVGLVRVRLPAASTDRHMRSVLSGVRPT